MQEHNKNRKIYVFIQWKKLMDKIFLLIFQNIQRHSYRKLLDFSYNKSDIISNDKFLEMSKRNEQIQYVKTRI